MILMKNNKIIASWDKIEPGDSANERMLSAILERNRSVHDRKGKVSSMSQEKSKKYLIPVVSCLAAIITITGIIGNNLNWFGSKEYTVNLANGDSVVYHNGSTCDVELEFDFPLSTRDLTDSELSLIFPGTVEPAAAHGTFKDETGELIRIEGKIGEADVIIVQSGFPATDVIVEGNESISAVSGIPVTTGYFITKPDSKGLQTAIFFGSFTIGNKDIYVELAGDKSDTDVISQSITNLILEIIENGEPDFSAIAR